MTEQVRVEYRPLIRDLPAGERPRERLKHAGEGALSTTELLAIILGTGVGGESVLDMAQRLLSRYGGLPGLARASFAELESEKGLGEAKTAQIKAALEIGRRMLLISPEERCAVRSPADVAQLLMAEMSHLEQEHFRALYLDTRNRLLGSETIYVGSLNASHIRVGEVFRDAVKRNCAAIIPAVTLTPRQNSLTPLRRPWPAGSWRTCSPLGPSKYKALCETRSTTP